MCVFVIGNTYAFIYIQIATFKKVPKALATKNFFIELSILSTFVELFYLND